MKTLSQIKDQYANNQGFENWEFYLNDISPSEEVYNEIAKIYAENVSEQSLRDAFDKLILIKENNSEGDFLIYIYEKEYLDMEIKLP